MDIPEIEIPDIPAIPDIQLPQSEVRGDRIPQLATKGNASRCINRPGGSSGRSGRDGEDGDTGRLYLVQQGTDLRPDQPAQTLDLYSFEQTPTLSLTKNIWDARQGALALLAPSSVMADEYYEYQERLERNYQLTWDALSPVVDFPNEPVQLMLTETGDLKIQSPEDTWLVVQMSAERCYPSCGDGCCRARGGDSASLDPSFGSRI